ncbi:hypothetical protein C7H19_18260 [Aphanothece hegewaldii CCALA 016]|uniref:Uncharacterized protein n=1 Tax=Aphanothece hegewaldii CCALA 016 TaxID=2107694 RepID=A0A2T1LU31_9CHRO|nr:hypothetical protein [Aphanothece hegewaldii]PSF34950.1 hypothetical protein C7H19_18260 [Aphanothece hegewaldii CCALA 016]
MDKYRQIPEGLYQRLLEYLQLHAVTDSWSEELLKELEEDAEVTIRQTSNSYIIDSSIKADYKIN